MDLEDRTAAMRARSRPGRRRESRPATDRAEDINESYRADLLVWIRGTPTAKPYHTPETSRELFRLERWRDNRARVALYYRMIDQRKWPAGVDVAAIRRKCRKILGE